MHFVRIVTVLAGALLLSTTSVVPNGNPALIKSVPLHRLKAQLDTGQLRVHFIDIGPGLAVFIQTPGNRKNIFIDGGKWGIKFMKQ